MRPCLPYRVVRRITRCPSLLPASVLLLLLLTAAPPLCHCHGGDLEYRCNNLSAPAVACTAYLTFRSTPPFYTSPVSVSYLLNANAPAVAAANEINISLAVAPVPSQHMLLVPVPCSCTSSGYYQHNTTYVLQEGDMFYNIAMLTFQNLTSHHAIRYQNPVITNIKVNSPITVPLLCACPSAEQAAEGVRYLLTYAAGEEDEHTVARHFRVDLHAIRGANRFPQDYTLFVPLKNAPTPDMLASFDPMAAAPAPAPASPVVPVSHCWPRSRRWIDVGIGSGCGVLVSAAIVTLSFLQRPRHRRRRQHGRTSAKVKDTPLAAAVHHAVNSLAIYAYPELDRATAGFAEERRVSGSSVYRALIDGQTFAVKRVSGDVRGEVGVLGRVSHSCLIRLSGLYAHAGDSYLVLELAENGSLSDWLHGGNASYLLNWKQRVQVARDVASGLDYLHHFTSPPYVHKNLTTGTVLLDAKLRAKVSGFGLARAVAVGAGGGVHTTRHVVGTQGYMAPEYLEHGLIGTQMDVFAFGVVLLELLSGKEAVLAGGIDDGRASASSLLWEAAEGVVDGGDDAWFRLKEFMDPRLQGHYPFGLAFTMAALALRCVAREPRARPSMGEALVLVSAVHDSTVDWDPQNYGVSDSMVLGR